MEQTEFIEVTIATSTSQEQRSCKSLIRCKDDSLHDNLGDGIANSLRGIDTAHPLQVLARAVSHFTELAGLTSEANEFAEAALRFLEPVETLHGKYTVMGEYSEASDDDMAAGT